MPKRWGSRPPRRRPMTTSVQPWPALSARPGPGTATTGNSSPLAAWIVITRTPSWPSARDGGHALALVALGALASAASEEAGEVAALVALELAAPGASACGRWPSGAGPPGRSQQREVVAERGHRRARPAPRARSAARRRAGRRGWRRSAADAPRSSAGHAPATPSRVACRLALAAAEAPARPRGQMWRPVPGRLAQQPERVGADAGGRGRERRRTAPRRRAGSRRSRAGRPRPRPAVGTSSRGRRPRRGRGRPARARPRRRRRG